MGGIHELTKQERTVLALVARGWRNTDIAHELVISTRTVETHLYHIFDKLRVSSRTEAAIYALRSDPVSRLEFNGITDARANGTSLYRP
jgi:DNA-binding NarL/FixJ family response regulator